MNIVKLEQMNIVELK
jgi:hypothetical protein